MILAFDTYYFNNKAKTVCIVFNNWTDEKPSQVLTEILENSEEYVPGEFYRREMPCILSLLKEINLKQVEAIVIDGFVYLNDEQKPGLGGHLYHALEKKVPVIGVAKTNFASIEKLKRPLLRGESQRPLFVTAIGMDPDTAAEYIQHMSGAFRIPVLLKELDRLSKEP